MANQKFFSPSLAISGFCGHRLLPYGGGCSFRLVRRPKISLPTISYFPETMKKVRPLLCSASAICEIDNDDGAPQHPPCTLSSPLIFIGDEDDNDRYCFYSLCGDEKIIRIEKNQSSWRRNELCGARLVGSSEGWIASINPRNCNLYLSNPLSPKTSPIIPLPPIETLPVVTSRHFIRRRTDQSSEYQFDYYNSDEESNYDENDLKAVEAYESGTTNDFDTSFSLRNHPSLAPARVTAQKLSTEFVSKVAISSEPPSPANGYANWNKCAVAIIYGHMSEFAELALCILGDSGWTPLECPLKEYVDILFSKHSNNDKLVLFALSFLGAIESYEFDSHRLSSPRRRIVKMSSPEEDNAVEPRRANRKYLVETSSGDLLMVRKFVSSAHEFDVHRLDMEESKWVRVECLGDEEAFFVSSEESVLLSVGEFSGLRPNCIYFMDRSSSGHVGVFSLEDKTVATEAFGYGVNFLGKKYKALPFWLVPNPW